MISKSVDLNGRNVLVTGCARGIGAAAADVILKGTFLCTQAVSLHIRELRYREIVTISSSSGVKGGAVSKFDDNLEQIRGRWGLAYAETIIFLASDASNYITGQVLDIDGGWVMA